MGDEENLVGALAVAGIVGLGLWGLSVANKSAREQADRRQAFHARLAADLAQHEVRVVSAELGRGGNAEPVWILAVKYGIQLFSFSAVFPAEAEPYGDPVRLDLQQRVLGQLGIAA